MDIAAPGRKSQASARIKFTRTVVARYELSFRGAERARPEQSRMGGNLNGLPRLYTRLQVVRLPRASGPRNDKPTHNRQKAAVDSVHAQAETSLLLLSLLFVGDYRQPEFNGHAQCLMENAP